MKDKICGIFFSALTLGGIIYTITVSNKEIISPSQQPSFPPLFPQLLIPQPCYSCLGNPCRSCYNPSVSGRYEYTKYCCSYCGGCMT